MEQQGPTVEHTELYSSITEERMKKRIYIFRYVYLDHFAAQGCKSTIVQKIN